MLSPLIFRFLSSFFFSFFYLFFFSNTFFFVCVPVCVCMCVCMCVLWSEGLKVINSSMKQSFNPEDHDDEFDMQSM